MSDTEQDFNQADFDAFRADPKRQALVKRILADEVTETGHIVGATYRSRYWGGEYRVIGSAETRFGEGVEVECVVPGDGAHQTVGKRWTHRTRLDPKDQRVD